MGLDVFPCFVKGGLKVSYRLGESDTSKAKRTGDSIFWVLLLYPEREKAWLELKYEECSM